MSETYNGWTDFKTWAAFTWLTDSEGGQAQCGALAEEARATDDPVRNLADMLRDIIMNNAPEIGPSMYSDILTEALENINYNEMARVFLEP